MSAPTRFPALFLDRDGVINHEVGYLYRSEDVRWVEGIVPLCRTAMSLGYRIVVITNQSGIARGLYTQHDFENLTRWMRAELLRDHVTLDAVYCCPFHPEHGIGDYKREHEDRKPSPGMLFRAVRELDVDLPRSILVGDRCSDIAAGRAAGLRECFLMAGTEHLPCTAAHLAIRSLDEVAAWLRTAAGLSTP